VQIFNRGRSTSIWRCHYFWKARERLQIWSMEFQKYESTRQSMWPYLLLNNATEVKRHYQGMLECIGEIIRPDAVERELMLCSIVSQRMKIFKEHLQVKFVELPWPSSGQRLELLLKNKAGSRKPSSMDSSCTKWMKLPAAAHSEGLAIDEDRRRQRNPHQIMGASSSSITSTQIMVIYAM
jgi:hypothetical protein